MRAGGDPGALERKFRAQHRSRRTFSHSWQDEAETWVLRHEEWARERGLEESEQEAAAEVAREANRRKREREQRQAKKAHEQLKAELKPGDADSLKSELEKAWT